MGRTRTSHGTDTDVVYFTSCVRRRARMSLSSSRESSGPVALTAPKELAAQRAACTNRLKYKAVLTILTCHPPPSPRGRAGSVGPRCPPCSAGAPSAAAGGGR
eukprot:scaffold96741_cov64-Phaeocystis_antarctica.AAC.7